MLSLHSYLHRHYYYPSCRFYFYYNAYPTSHTSVFMIIFILVVAFVMMSCATVESYEHLLCYTCCYT